MIVAGGALLEDVVLDSSETVSVRYAKCDDGWSAEFTVTAPGVDDLQVLHRLTAPTLGEARRLVAPAVAFLGGAPTDPLG
ncbi:MAG: hypothetical protein ABIM89_03265 [Mycobacteriales bacterium]